MSPFIIHKLHHFKDTGYNWSTDQEQYVATHNDILIVNLFHCFLFSPQAGIKIFAGPRGQKLSFLAPIMSCERQSRPPLRLIVLHFIAKQLPIEIRVEIKSSQQIVTIFVTLLRKWLRCKWLTLPKELVSEISSLSWDRPHVCSNRV